MIGIINGITWLMDTVTMIWGFAMSIIKTIIMVFQYLITCVGLAFTVAATLPEWLRAFCIITIAISIAYFLIGRDAGKSD